MDDTVNGNTSTEVSPKGTAVAENIASRQTSISENESVSTGFFPRNFKVKIIIPIILTLLIISSSVSYFFVFVPRVQAREFVEGVSKDFYEIQGSIRKISENYGNVSESFEISKGAFFEITNLRTYKDAKADTAQDIVDIQDTLSKIKKAQEKKESYKVPGSVIELDSKLDTYYTTLGTAMNSLLIFEQFQMSMLNAVGDEYNNHIEKLPSVYVSGALRADIVKYFEDLIILGDAAIDRLEKLEEPVEDQIWSKNYHLTSEKDRIDTAKKLVQEFLIGNQEHDLVANEILNQFAQRVQDRKKELGENAQKIVTDSNLRKEFDAVLKAENDLTSILNEMREKYGFDRKEDDVEESSQSARPEQEKESTPSVNEKDETESTSSAVQGVKDFIIQGY